MAPQTINRHAEGDPGSMQDAAYEKIRRILACPACRTPLALDPHAAAILCPGCRAEYPIVQGVPIMLKNYSMPRDGRAEDRPESLAALKRLPVIGGLLRGFLAPPGGLINIAAPENYTQLRQLLSTISHPQLLYVGGAHGLGFGSHNLGPELLQSVVNTDIAGLPGVDLVADGHYLPFVNESFDGVVIQSVLQHTQEPRVVVEEILRVLRPGGYVYSEVPFLQRYYPGHDYQRFTSEGLEYLFRDFQRIRSGMSNGPASSFAHVAAYFLAALFSFRSEALYKLLLTGFRWAFAPLRYLDWALKDHHHAWEVASGFYFLGKKQEGAHRI